jgi:hypothetical protein
MQAKYDQDHAMVLAQMHDFRAGIIFLYEKAKMYADVIVSTQESHSAGV